MSASTEKKIRQAAREAGTDKKVLAARAEAEKQAKSKLKWVLGTILVVLLIASILFFSSDLFSNNVTAVTIGGEKYNRGEVNCNAANQYYSFLNQYGQYASMFGLDTSGGFAGLSMQECGMTDGGTWKDYFVEQGIQQMTRIKVLADKAREQGLVLTDEDIAQVDQTISDLKLQAAAYGYSSFKQFLGMCYGSGVTEKVMRDQQLETALAAKAEDAFIDAQEYTADELEAQYKSYEGAYDVYSFSFVNVTAEVAEGADAADEQAVKAAKAKADEIMAAYKADQEQYDSDTDKLNAAAVSVDEELSAAEQSNVTGSSLGAIADWMQKASRKAGDVDVIEIGSDDAVSGYFVVVFGSHSDNHYNTVNVRHILVKAEADENGEYTDEAIAAAKQRAEEIYAEWKSGDKTEESFAALANEHSEDGGSNTNGGLYENIVEGQMVPEFDAFCFAGHKPGDTDIVTVKAANYAGAHIIYFSGEGEMYSDLIAKKDLVQSAYSAWLEELMSGYEAKAGFGMKFAD